MVNSPNLHTLPTIFSGDLRCLIFSFESQFFFLYSHIVTKPCYMFLWTEIIKQKFVISIISMVILVKHGELQYIIILYSMHEVLRKHFFKIP